MLAKKITYEDFNGVTRTETFYFNLSKSELLKLDLTTQGGYAERVQRIIDSPDVPTLTSVFEDFILRSFGVKSEDGKKLMKGENFEYAKEFMATNAYDVLFVELISDANKASEFLNGIIPSDMMAQVQNDPKYLEAKAKLESQN